MGYKTIYLKAALCLATFFVTSQPFWAMGAGRCEAVFGRTSYLKESRESIRTLSREIIEFRNSLKEAPHKFDSHQVRTKIQNFSTLAEQYFQDAGIQTTEKSARIEFHGLKDKETLVVDYPIYKLQGTRGGDEISRLIFGVQSHPQYVKHPLNFEFDILFLLNDTAVGVYSPAATSIKFGPYAIAGEISGLTSTLRHEVQHFMEQVKIYEKQQTTARISFSEKKTTSKEPYADYFRLDEIETHLRDIRTALSFEARKAKDFVFSSSVKPEVWASILKNREVALSDKFVIIERMLKVSEEKLIEMQKRGLPTAFLENHRNGEWMGAYLFENSSYSVANIDFYGLFPKPRYQMSDAEVSTIVQTTLQWNLNRVREIESELNSLKIKLKTHVKSK